MVHFANYAFCIMSKYLCVTLSCGVYEYIYVLKQVYLTSDYEILYIKITLV